MKPERVDKLHKTGLPGLLLNKTKSGYKFQLYVPGHKRHSVYIGTENTWLANYDLALEHAKELYGYLQGEQL